MRYAVGIALSRVKRNLRPYGFIALQLFVGFLVLCTVLNADFSVRERLAELRGEIIESEIRADILNSSVADGSFGIETFERLKGSASCDTGLVTTAMIAAVWDGNPETVAVVCVPERYMEDRFSAEIPENAVLCTQNPADAIRNGGLRLYGNAEISYSAEGLTVNGRTFPLTVLDPPDGIEALSRDENREHDLPLDTVLFFPEEAGEVWAGEDFVSFQVFLYPDGQNGYSAAYGSLYRDLRDVSFSIYDPGAFLVKTCQSLTDAVQILNLLSGVLLAITGIGTVGILLIELYRRREETAVSLAVGATRGRIRFELFAEIFFVCFAGIIVGAAGSILLTRLAAASQSFVTIRTVRKTWGIALLSAVCLPSAAAVLALAGFGKFNVSAVLRGEE